MPPRQSRPGVGTEAAEVSFDGDATTVPRTADSTMVDALVSFVDHFQRRVLLDALNEASAGYWERRAAAYQAIVDGPEGFTGQTTPEQRAERRERLRAIAAACRMKASVLRRYPVITETDLLRVLDGQEVAR